MPFAGRFGEERTTFFADSANFGEILERYWEHDVPPAAYRSLNEARWELEDQGEPRAKILFSLRKPDWYVGFSTEFVKSIAKVDRSKRGRLLEAIPKMIKQERIEAFKSLVFAERVGSD